MLEKTTDVAFSIIKLKIIGFFEKSIFKGHEFLEAIRWGDKIQLEKIVHFLQLGGVRNVFGIIAKQNLNSRMIIFFGCKNKRFKIFPSKF